MPEKVREQMNQNLQQTTRMVMHQQVNQELMQANRLDTKIVIISIVVSLILFGLALSFSLGTTDTISGLFGMGHGKVVVNTAPTIIMFVCILAIVAINWFAVQTLLRNKKQRATFNLGLTKLFKDEGLTQYYDGSVFQSYETRYNLFAVILISVGAVSVITPLVIFINQLVEM